jgi:hypothetical protein
MLMAGQDILLKSTILLKNHKVVEKPSTTCWYFARIVMQKKTYGLIKVNPDYTIEENGRQRPLMQDRHLNLDERDK